MTKKVWLILLAVVFVFGFSLLGCSDDGGGGGDDPVVVWRPSITGTTTIFDTEYIGQTGIKSQDKATTTLGVVAGGFTFTSTGQYKAIVVQFPNAGGSNYYTNEGATGVTNGKTYTISFMASVASGAGQLRFAANDGNLNDGPTKVLSSTPTLVTYSWTQTGNNLKFDSGNSAANFVITITGIKITTP
jgi:hypothetical protein